MEPNLFRIDTEMPVDLLAPIVALPLLTEPEISHSTGYNLIAFFPFFSGNQRLLSCLRILGYVRSQYCFVNSHGNDPLRKAWGKSWNNGKRF